MKQEGLQYFTDYQMIIVALLLFVFSFSVICLMALKGRNQHIDQKIQMLPLEDGHE